MSRPTERDSLLRIQLRTTRMLALLELDAPLNVLLQERALIMKAVDEWLDALNLPADENGKRE